MSEVPSELKTLPTLETDDGCFHPIESTKDLEKIRSEEMSGIKIIGDDIYYDGQLIGMLFNIAHPSIRKAFEEELEYDFDMLRRSIANMHDVCNAQE